MAKQADEPKIKWLFYFKCYFNGGRDIWNSPQVIIANDETAARKLLPKPEGPAGGHLWVMSDSMPINKNINVSRIKFRE